MVRFEGKYFFRRLHDFFGLFFFSLLILVGFQPESEWDRAQSESVMITTNDLVDSLGYQLYMYIVWKVKLISGIKFVVID